MKNPTLFRANHLARVCGLCVMVGLFAMSSARAGLSLEMNVIRYHQYGYYFSPNLTTNTTPANVTFGDYFIASSGYPTNGSSSLYHFDSNGFNQVSGGSSGYGDFDGMIRELTNGLWSIFVTNTVTTNVYRFKVTCNISSNDLPYVSITSPADGAVNVTNRPTYIWQGPTNYNNLVLYYYNSGITLPVTQTSLLSSVLYQGLNSVTPHYDSNSTTAVVSSVPTNNAAQAISSWVSTAHLQDYSSSEFTVGAVDTSGTGHTLVAHYPWDGTNANGSASGADTSGNGYHMNFGGSFGSQGGTNSNTDPAAGPRAIQFHNGNGNSAGYVGWNPTPTNLLTALSGSFSISCWIKTTQNNFGWDQAPAYYGAGIVSADNGSLANDVVPLALTGSKIGFNTGGSLEDVTLNSTAAVNDGNYHHIVVARNQPTGQKQIYIDGVLDSFSSGTTNVLNDAQKLTIGALADASDPDANNFSYYNGYEGKLDDLQIYSGVLSSNEVASLYANPGNTIADSSGVTLAQAVDTTGLVWTTGGDANWFGQTTNTHDTVDAAQSGAIGDDESSWIETTVTGPGTLSFWWKASSEDGGDYLEFLMDGSFQTDLTGNFGWFQGNYSIAAGSHTLRWNYYKDSCCPDYLDAGFLDEVSFVVTPPNTNTPPVITINPFNQTNYPGYNVALFAAATSNAAITWQWYKTSTASPVANATNALYIPANSGTAGVAGNYFAIATNLVGSATTTVATVTFQNAALPPDWTRVFKSALTNNPANVTADINLASLLDASGNLYSVGSVTGTNVFGSDILISANDREGSSFLKQTATGTPIWGRCMTNNGNGNSFPRGIVTAPGDGFYVFGLFRGTNWLGTNKLVDIGGGSTYLARFDANGSNVWLRTITGTNFNFPTHHGLVSDSAGNVTLSALIWGYTSFGTTNLFADGQRGVLAQYDASGNVRWVQVPSAWPDYLAYSAGRIYGCMGGTETNFIGGVTNISDRRRALFSLNATNGQGLWLRGYAANKDQGSPNGFGDNNAAVAVSGTNVFVVGTAYGTNVTFGPFTLDYPDTTGQYLARYDTNGNAQLATAFGSSYTYPWAALADAAGNIYVGADFDTYSIFGSKIIAAPFNGTNGTVQFIGTLDVRIPGQACVAKFDRNGNPLWARLAQSPSSYLNVRDITLAADGVWACGFFQPIGIFGTNTIFGGLPPYHRSGYLAKITDGAAVALPVTLLNPLTPGANFQFQFLSQAGFTHAVQYRTNLVAGLNWQTWSNVTGDGALKTIPIPLTVFNPAKQGFVRILTQ